MDLAWNDARTRKFATIVGLITSSGPHGENIMAAEWTHQISYSPALFAVHISPENSTAENISGSREFGVNLASDYQNVASSIGGRYRGAEVDKIAMLKELGYEFYEGKMIKAPMLKGAVLNAECKLVFQKQLSDHIMFAGEVLELSADETKTPLLYRDGKYWKIGERIQKPPEEFRKKIEELASKHRK